MIHFLERSKWNSSHFSRRGEKANIFERRKDRFGTKQRWKFCEKRFQEICRLSSRRINRTRVSFSREISSVEGGEKISLRAIIGQSPRGDKERRRWKKLSERTRADRLKNVNDSSSKLEAVALVKGNRINARKTSFGLEADPGKPLLFPRIDIVRIKPIDLLPIIGVERNHLASFSFPPICPDTPCIAGSARPGRRSKWQFDVSFPDIIEIAIIDVTNLR